MSNIFEGKKVAVTGKFNNLKRSDIEVRLIALGASIAKSVSTKTDILVAGEKAGSKLQKAKDLNLQILDETTLQAQFAKIDDSALESVAKSISAKQKDKPAKQMDADVTAHIQKDIEAHKLTLASRLKIYFKTLAQRPDLHIKGEWRSGKPLAKAFGKPASISSINKWKHQLPVDYLAFLSEVGKFKFEWGFKELGEQLTKDDYFQPRDACAVFNFRGVSRSPQWYSKPDYDDDFDYVESTMFDEMVAEGFTEYAYESDGSRAKAYLEFANANDCDRSYMGSIESYLTEGAKNAFVWYWQVSSWTGQNALTELKKRSIPASTAPKEIIKLLEATGCTKIEAEALHQWLGDAVVVLLPA